MLVLHRPKALREEARHGCYHCRYFRRLHSLKMEVSSSFMLRHWRSNRLTKNINWHNAHYGIRDDDSANKRMLQGWVQNASRSMKSRFDDIFVKVCRCLKHMLANRFQHQHFPGGPVYYLQRKAGGSLDARCTWLHWAHHRMPRQ